MCGIVGYVGPRAGPGRRGRGPAAPGVPRLRLGRRRDHRLRRPGQLQVAKKAGRIENLDKELATRTITRHHRHGPHPVGHARRPQRPQRPPAPERRRAHRRRPQRHHRELRRAARRARARRASSSPATPTPRSSPTWSPGTSTSTAARWPTRCARSAGGCAARSPWCCSTPPSPTSSSPPAATRRWCSASATARRSSAATSPRSSSSPARPSSWARTRSSRSAATATRSPTSTARRPRAPRSTSTGTSPPPRRAATSTSCSRRSPSSRRRCATRCIGHLTGGQIVLDEQRLDPQELRDVDKVFIVACGTAYHSGLIGKQAIEHWTRVPVEVEMASEFRYRDPVLDRQTLVVAISQSGETADTLEAVRHAKDQRAKVLAICNTNGAQIPRESDAVLYTHAGPEIGVAATKTFLAQVAAVELVGLALAQARGTKYGDEVRREFEALCEMPDAIARGAGHDGRRARAGPRHRAVAHRAVPRPARRLPGGARGRAQAQGARLHARRGLPGRRAQARPDRAHRGRAAGRRRHAVADRAAGAAPEDAVQRRRDPAPAARARS